MTYLITNIISSIDKSTGGPARSVPILCEILSDDFNVQLLSTSSSEPVTISTKIKLNLFEKSAFPFLNQLFYSRKLDSFLKGHRPDLIITHGIWQLPFHYAVKRGYDNAIPTVCTPRGMLEPEALKFSKVKKRIVNTLWQHEDLKKVTYFHATSLMEANNIRKLGYRQPIAVVPNGINLNLYPCKLFLNASKHKKRLLFLSRIHPKKGLVNLIKIWSELQADTLEWELVIAGNDEVQHESELKKLASSLGLDWSTSLEGNCSLKFVGPVFGEDKVRLYQSSDLFILPTLSENFGMVVVEAMACGVPVLTTTGTPWSSLNDKGSGFWVDPDFESIYSALKHALSLELSVLVEMGKNATRHAQEYSIEHTSRQMSDFYRWCITQKDKPNFVYEDKAHA